MVVHRVRGRGVVDGEGRVRVLAMQALLVAIHPGLTSISLALRRHLVVLDHFIHSLPVESTFILDAVAVRKLGEVHFLEQRFQFGEILVEIRGLVPQGCENQTCGSNMMP